jgi:hypothetical protein
MVLNSDGQLKHCGSPNTWENLPLDFQKVENETSVGEYSPKKDTSRVYTKEEEKETDHASSTARQTGDFTTWWYYFKAVGIFPLVCFAIFIVLAALGSHFPSMFKKRSLVVPLTK